MELMSSAEYIDTVETSKGSKVAYGTFLNDEGEKYSVWVREGGGCMDITLNHAWGDSKTYVVDVNPLDSEKNPWLPGDDEELGKFADWALKKSDQWKRTIQKLA